MDTLPTTDGRIVQTVYTMQRTPHMEGTSHDTTTSRRQSRPDHGREYWLRVRLTVTRVPDNVGE
jgi:hypothetical protein